MQRRPARGRGPTLSGVTSNDVRAATKWPDPATGAASSSEQDAVTVNALGQVITRTDRNGTTHKYTYDVLGRLVRDVVDTLGSLTPALDGTVARVEYAYDALGNLALITSYNAVMGGAVVNEVRRAYNGLGQLVTEWQSHAGAVDTLTTPNVGYAYSEMPDGANHSRLTSVTYPSGYVLNYNYASGLDSTISRLSSLSDAGGTLESYDYLGLGAVVARKHPQPGVDLSYVKRSGEADGAAGDQYTGLDQFGRVEDQRWMTSFTGAAVSRLQYGYDRASNRTWRADLVGSGRDELYAYDGLGQVTSFDRGTLNGTKSGLTGSASRAIDWDFDALGNFQGVDLNGTTTSRTHNAQNEVTGVGSSTLAFDPNGNLTTDETGRQFRYDAWNRLVQVRDSSGMLLKTYAYDGLGRRVSEMPNGGSTTDLYYSAGWQVIEERVAGATTARYVWSPVYVDALVLRDRDTDANGSLDERLYALQDANFNVVALVNTSGAVVERYEYDPFGQQTVLDGSYGSRSGSGYAWTVGFQGMSFDVAAGLSHQRARWYSPTLGRWATVDPIGFAAGDVNLYRMEGNEPLGKVDPSGLRWTLVNAGIRVDEEIRSFRNNGYEYAANLLDHFRRGSGNTHITNMETDPARTREVTNESKHAIYDLISKYSLGSVGCPPTDGESIGSIKDKHIYFHSTPGFSLGSQAGAEYGNQKRKAGYDVYESSSLFAAMGGVNVTIRGTVTNVRRVNRTPTADGCTELYEFDVVANVLFHDRYTFEPNEWQRRLFDAYTAAQYLELKKIAKPFDTYVSFTSTYGKFYKQCRVKCCN